MMNNIRTKLQTNQNEYIKQYHLEDLKQSKFKVVKNYSNIINQNFLMFNEATVHLLIKIVENIYCNYKLNNLQCTFKVTAAQLTDKNIQYGISRKSDTTRKRLKLLEQEGIIKRIYTNGDQEGQYIILTTDITEFFYRDLKYHKNKIIDTPEEEIETINKEQINNDNINNISLIDNLQHEKQTLEEEIVKLKQQLVQFKQQITTKQQITSTTDITVYNEQLKELVSEDQQQEFINMFNEFCSIRKDSQNKTIAKKTPRGITLAINLLQKYKNEGYNVFDILQNCLARQWRGICLPREMQENNMQSIYKQEVKKAFIKQQAIVEAKEMVEVYNNNQKQIQINSQILSNKALSYIYYTAFLKNKQIYRPLYYLPFCNKKCDNYKKWIINIINHFVKKVIVQNYNQLQKQQDIKNCIYGILKYVENEKLPVSMVYIYSILSEIHYLLQEEKIKQSITIDTFYKLTNKHYILQFNKQVIQYALSNGLHENKENITIQELQESLT